MPASFPSQNRINAVRLAQPKLQGNPFDSDGPEHALVITFLPDPLKAAAEMARVVRPGGIVATYMWDFLGGGFPMAPISTAMKSLGMSTPAPPYVDASRRETMRTIWQQAGLQSIDTRVIRIPIVYSDFDDFWDSNSAPVGTAGKAIADLPPSARDELKARLREQLPIGSDGRIAYEAFANAAKGRVP